MLIFPPKLTIFLCVVYNVSTSFPVSLILFGSTVVFIFKGELCDTISVWFEFIGFMFKILITSDRDNLLG